MRQKFGGNRTVLDFISGSEYNSFPQIMDVSRTVFKRKDDAEKDDYLITINANDVDFEFLQAALLIVNQLGLDNHCSRRSDNMSVYLDGEYMDDIAIGAAIPPVRLSFPVDPDVVSPPESETVQESEDMDSSIYGEDDHAQDTFSCSLLSNSAKIPMIDEVNELLANRAQQRLSRDWISSNEKQKSPRTRHMIRRSMKLWSHMDS